MKTIEIIPAASEITITTHLLLICPENITLANTANPMKKNRIESSL